MINKEELRKTLQRRLNNEDCEKIIEELLSQNFDMLYLYELSFNGKHPEDFHSCWLIEKIQRKNPVILDIIIASLLKDFSRIENNSSMRIYAKMISNAFLLYKKNKASEKLIYAIENADKTILIEGCFNFLLNEKTRIATKIWLIQILINFVKENNWIYEELIHITYDLINSKTPAGRNFGKRFLNELRSLNI
ncbi:MAG: hypothetical protein LBM25_04680 [Bacteroidales bacterium]|jgi:hypothetical protein|nr:hypothetical protein [Bacteroidales bacterium]